MSGNVQVPKHLVVMRLYLLSLQLLQALLPVFGKLGLLALAGLCQRCLDLHLPLAASAQTIANGDDILKQDCTDRKYLLQHSANAATITER